MDTPDPREIDLDARFEELKRRRQLAARLGGDDAVARHHEYGRLTIRERIGELTDSGSFQEIGSLTGSGSYDDDGHLVDVTPAPYVMGLAAIDDRPVAIGGEDFTIRGGTSWGARRRKGGQGGFVEDLAHEFRIPLVNLIDGAGGSVTSVSSRGHSVFPGIFGFERSVQLLGEVPVVAAVMGTAAGGPAGRAILSHFSVMISRTSQVFAAGPPIVKRSLGQDIDKEALGGTSVAVDTSGTIHNAAADERDCFDQIRRFLTYLPSNVWELAPRTPTKDPAERRDPGLHTIIPQRRTRAYDMRQLLRMVIDRDSDFEIQPTFGRAVITTLARIDGYPVGIIANDPTIQGGAMDAASARKQVHFMELCDTFHLPVVFLVDVPGFMVGLTAEQEGALREGMRAVYTAGTMTVPTFTVVVRKCYGMAGMATCNKNGLDMKVAWPTAEWGSLPVEGGVAAAFRREIAAADDPGAREREIEAELRRYTSPFRTAEAFEVEEIIDPTETRPFLARFVALAYRRMAGTLGPRSIAGVQP
ncbi:MAG: carboxyl transferase domain-containing protein [Nitriliruptoraceae bacterium]